MCRSLEAASSYNTETLSLPPVNADLVRLTERMIAASFLLGYNHAENCPGKQKGGAVIQKNDHTFADKKDMPQVKMRQTVEPVPFEEAVTFLKGKVSMTKKEWTSLEPKLRFRAFTVALLAEADHIEAVRGTLARALENGSGFKPAWQEAKAIAQTAGASGFLPGYFETVYRTNVQTAYSAGRLLQYQNNMPPAWELMVLEDGRTSDTCKGIVSLIGNGKALPASHSFWKTYGFPPYHFNCRTSFRAVYDYEIGKEITIVNPSMKSLRKGFKPAKGFGGNPLEKESFWRLTPAMVRRATQYGVIMDIVKQAHDLDMHSYFPELLKSFTPVYKSKKHGYVHVANNWQYAESEMQAAKRLADIGHKIYMLPKTIKAKSPDMIIDDDIGEMKDCSSVSSIDSQLRSAIHQGARIVCLNVTKNIDTKTIKHVIENRRKRTANKLKNVFVLVHGTVLKI